jgi:hypothetical protein
MKQEFLKNALTAAVLLIVVTAFAAWFHVLWSAFAQ